MPRRTCPAVTLPRRALAGLSFAAVAATGCTPAAVIAPDGAAGPAADARGAHEVRVSIDSIGEAVGTVRVALYDGAAGYAAGEPVATVAAPAATGTVSVSLGPVPDGDYAVMLYHDVNGNETLDRNLLGIPRKPWTGSMHRAVLGAPDWDDIRFVLDGGDVELALSL